MMADNKVPILFLMLGLVLGSLGMYFYYTPKIDEVETNLQSTIENYLELSDKHDTLEQDHSTLFEEHKTIVDNYNRSIEEHEDLTNQYNSLSEDYSTISVQYNSLFTDHQDLQNNYNIISSDFSQLSTDYNFVLRDFHDLSIEVEDFFEQLNLLSSLPDSFQSVLIDSELEKIASTVELITKPLDSWYSVERIHKHVVSMVNYAEDVNIPYCQSIQYDYVDDKRVVNFFNIESVRNYIQTPIFTLEYAQGDCEDQAILEYAMIDYYEREIHGTDYLTYLAKITLDDGNGHVAVIIPAADNEICVLDPAGSYYTSRYGHIETRSASQELQQYSNLWSSYGGISTIELYDIDSSDGSYSIAASGTLEEIISFFESP
jgi:hypothetical protein